MTFQVASRTLQHRSGSKEYHLLKIRNMDTDDAILVMRWGKTGAWGQTKIETSAGGSIDQLHNAKIREKEKGGYEETRQKTTVVEDLAAVAKLIGPQYYRNLGAANITHLDKTADTTGIKEPAEVKFQERPDGTWAVDNAPKKSPPMKIEEESFEDRQARDPLWGMF